MTRRPLRYCRLDGESWGLERPAPTQLSDLVWPESNLHFEPQLVRLEVLGGERAWKAEQQPALEQQLAGKHFLGQAAAPVGDEVIDGSRPRKWYARYR
jgi:hypothetical protein